MSVAAAPGTATTVPGVVGIDLPARTLREADSAAHSLVAALSALHGPEVLAGAVVASHLTRLGPRPHLTLSVRVPGLPAAEVLAAAGTLPEAGTGPAALPGAQAHAAGTSGRVIHFPGVEDLVGTLPLAEVLRRSAVDEVVLLGVPEQLDPATPLRTRDHVRPSLVDRRLVLEVEWAAGRVLVPFEVPFPTPCCADHS